MRESHCERSVSFPDFRASFEESSRAFFPHFFRTKLQAQDPNVTSPSSPIDFPVLYASPEKRCSTLSPSASAICFSPSREKIMLIISRRTPHLVSMIFATSSALETMRESMSHLISLFFVVFLSVSGSISIRAYIFP